MCSSISTRSSCSSRRSLHQSCRQENHAVTRTRKTIIFGSLGDADNRSMGAGRNDTSNTKENGVFSVEQFQLNTKRQNDNNSSGKHDGSNDDDRSNLLFTIPIFPLRKLIRLPTDTLELNLYEPRYLEMSEFILNENYGIFGALHVWNKPQLVTQNGNGPIVPMLNVGDVGVVCVVQKYQDDKFVPISKESTSANTTSMSPGTLPFTRRRIKLQAMAVTRFRIERILHTGVGDVAASVGQTATSTTSLSSSSSPPLPFIVVETSWFHDTNDNNDNDEDQEKIRRLVDELEKQIQITSTTTKPPSPSSSLKDGEDEEARTTTTTAGTSWENVAKMVEQIMMMDGGNGTGNSGNCATSIRDEIFSFAAATSLLSANDRSTANDMKNVLELQSTRDRLECIKEKSNKGKKRFFLF